MVTSLAFAYSTPMLGGDGSALNVQYDGHSYVAGLRLGL